jgi:hypothetical protein
MKKFLFFIFLLCNCLLYAQTGLRTKHNKIVKQSDIISWRGAPQKVFDDGKGGSVLVYVKLFDENGGGSGKFSGNKPQKTSWYYNPAPQDLQSCGAGGVTILQLLWAFLHLCQISKFKQLYLQTAQNFKLQ